MKLSFGLIALLAMAPLAVFLRGEEPTSTYRSDAAKPHTRPAKDGEKKKPAHLVEGKEVARLKALEKENTHLRQELARKGGNAADAASEAASPEGAMAELKAGNARFASGTRTRTQMGYNDIALRQSLAKGQAPFAVIVTCSDSRLVDGFIFDQELGRLFTVREAGNCPDIQSLASIEYAVEHLGSKVVVVMGHESCGAVSAVLAAGPTPLPGNLWSLQAAMAGLLESVHHPTAEPTSEYLSHLVEANAMRQAKVVLTRSEIVQHLCREGKLTAVPAVYDLASGIVRFLPALASNPQKAEAHP